MKVKSKKELAKLYEFSKTTLNNYLNTGKLFLLLSQTGYFKYNKILTPKQIHIIFEFLGRPD
jgi:rRNA pseudouridine-1189 N-methylase Emg1 (Nep1/Mra1 family)